MTNEMQDTDMVAKISGGDLMTIGAKHHRQCLTAYRNTYRPRCRQHNCQQNVHQERNKLSVLHHSYDSVQVATEGTG